MNLNRSLLAFAILLAATPRSQADHSVSTNVKRDGFAGMFFAGSDEAHRVGILVLGGSEGGIPSQQAKRYSDIGYSVLAVGFFKAEGTPTNLDRIPLEYFDKPLAWFAARAEMANREIVVVGSSKGGELALLLASRHAEIAGVIASVPSHVVFQGIPKVFWPPRSSWTSGGKEVPYVPYDVSAGVNLSNLRPLYEKSLTHQKLVEEARIPVEKINGPILVLSGAADTMWPSSAMGEEIISTLRSKEFSHPFHHETYVDAGHSLNEFFMMGGTKEGNQTARIDSWNRQVEFLEELQRTR